MNPDRKLVTLRRIRAIEPIPAADQIEVALLDGWKVAVRKNEFQVGDLVLYFEVDSFLPVENAAFHFLVKSSHRTMGDSYGHHLRTVKLRGQLSQGLVMHTHHFPALQALLLGATDPNTIDIDSILHVVSYEADIPEDLVDVIKGGYPIFLSRVRPERVQNVPHVLTEHDAIYTRTMKLHGETMTMYARNGLVGVCGTNWEFKLSADHRMPTLARVSGVLRALIELGRNVAIQGEFMGPDVQKNRERFAEHRFYMFAAYDIDTRKYLSVNDTLRLYARIAAFSYVDDETRFQYVPILTSRTRFAPGATLDEVLTSAEGASINHTYREGDVWTRYDGSGSVKVISNKFLLKEGE